MENDHFMKILCIDKSSKKGVSDKNQ